MIELESRGTITTIRLRRGKGNALNIELLQAIDEALVSVESGDARAAIITGEGNVFGAGVDLHSRFASSGAGVGGLGIGEGGGGAGWSLGTSFGRYVGSLRKVGLDVALVVDSTGSMQNVIDQLKKRLDDLTTTMQRLVPTARIGAVAFRDRDDGKTASAPRQSEDFLVRWTDLINGPHWVVVTKGEVPDDAHLTFATLREARAWMAENGFTR